MGKRISQCLWAGLLLAGASAQAAEFTACIVDDAIPNNPVYYYLPTTGSKLRCEIDRPDYHPTLRELYAEGWSIVNILDPKVAQKAGSNSRPSPVIYLERSGMVVPPAPAPAPQAAPPSPEKKGIFGF
jgi:hypothetical protein